MWRILKIVVLFSFCHVYVKAVDVADSFSKYSVVPDVIPVAPFGLAVVKYNMRTKVMLGNEICPSKTINSPSVQWEADSSCFYTLAMVDPDVPSRGTPFLREILHWLVGNIPGENVKKGETLASYISSAPPPGSGLHRYVFLVYEQPDQIPFNESLFNFTTTQLRVNFSMSRFADEYNLGDPVFGNFFQAKTT